MGYITLTCTLPFFWVGYAVLLHATYAENWRRGTQQCNFPIYKIFCFDLLVLIVYIFHSYQKIGSVDTLIYLIDLEMYAIFTGQKQRHSWALKVKSLQLWYWLGLCSLLFSPILSIFFLQNKLKICLFFAKDLKNHLRLPGAFFESIS